MSNNSKPNFEVFTIRSSVVNNQVKSRWTKIGAAWTHNNGEGFNIVLDAFPVDGKLTVIKPKPAEQEQSTVADDTGF